MTAHNSNLDGSLKLWEEIKGQFEKSEILIGNGLSCAVWDKFQYPSLYEKALSNSNHRLSKLDIKLFKDWGEDGNFEKVLSNLLITKRTNEILDPNNADFQTVIRERYTNICNALIEAVSKVHISSQKIKQNPNVLFSIRKELKNYSCVYSTNYDLLIYWARMIDKTDQDSFKDYFWRDNTFDIMNTDVVGNSTRVLYLHGALHLCREMERTKKLTHKQELRQTILDQFETLWDIEKNRTPLFIAEGNSRKKLESIYKSDYLSFAYSQFQIHKESLVIFGHSLRDSDQHLVDAIKTARISRIAISMRKPDQEYMEKLKKIFKPSHLFFFDAESHPLGDPSLKVAV